MASDVTRDDDFCGPTLMIDHGAPEGTTGKIVDSDGVEYTEMPTQCPRCKRGELECGYGLMGGGFGGYVFCVIDHCTWMAKHREEEPNGV